MNRFDAWMVHVATLLVGGTGVVYALMRYFVEPADPYAVINHPWQPAVQHLHVWVAPLLVFGAGVVWREHVWKHWRRGVRPRRVSGVVMMLDLIPMIASGYLIQTAVTSGWRTAWITVHLVTSGLWLLGWTGHLVSPVLARRRRRAATEPSAAVGGLAEGGS
ncbi:MAG TPA: hypothetical protein VHQ65_15840 [Thermoanaerobaculia bacterium]|nr:hypothetical protein [Thermoanaerobaculia bacterium]